MRPKEIKTLRRMIIFIFITMLALIVILINNYAPQQLQNELVPDYQNNHFVETGANNIVTAIYLNYRVYDTLFEALTLLVSVLGIIHFSRHEGGINE